MPCLSYAWLGFGVDTSDPKAVAEDFLLHVRERSYNKAIEHVIPEDREAFESDSFYNELDKSPPIPEEPKVEIVLKGHSGEARVTNWIENAGFDIKYRKDRWWITK
jgi:hypothetical protein